VWRCRVLGELGTSVDVRETKEQGQVGLYLHFGPFRPMIFFISYLHNSIHVHI
jgi:hypothetical protein